MLCLWDNWVFHPHIENVQGFRLLMAKYRAIVSGSSVLRAFLLSRSCAVRWQSGDLDLYVPKEDLGPAGLLEWHIFLTTVERLSLQEPDAHHSDSYGDEVSLAFKLPKLALFDTECLGVHFFFSGEKCSVDYHV